MKLPVFIIFITLCLNVSSQRRTTILPEPTSQVIADISIGWKKDSIGKDKYRLQVFERLRYSKIDGLSKQDLFKGLGKPHHVSRFYNGITKKNYVGYEYYVLCLNNYPKEKFYLGSFIEFVFDESETQLLEIEDGDYCG